MLIFFLFEAISHSFVLREKPLLIFMNLEVACYVKTIIVFYKFYDIFCSRHSLMNRLCYNNLFQFIQHDNFRILNRVVFTHWKHLQIRNAFWYCFPVIQRYTIHYLMKSTSIARNQSSFEILQLLDIWRYQSLVI